MINTCEISTGISRTRRLAAMCLLLLCLPNTALQATELAQFAPQVPTKNPFSDAWYYYIHDEQVGYYKITFLAYLNDETPDNKPHAYIHVVYAAKSGEKRYYDYYFEQLETSRGTGKHPWSFEFNVPGKAQISEDRIALTLPGVSLEADISDQHQHYWQHDNPGASPFGWLTSLPFVENQWFVFSLGTPTRYRYTDAQVSHSGEGLTYIDRGWNSGQAAGMVYVTGVSPEAKFMFTGGTDGKLPIETWVGRLITAQHDLTFPVSLKGFGTENALDPCAASATIEMEQDDYRVVVKSTAAPGSFYDHRTPSVTVFNAPNAVMKSMHARANIEVYKQEQLVEALAVDQSLLEFGGVYYCHDKAVQTR
jgi:hypothetical protein